MPDSVFTGTCRQQFLLVQVRGVSYLPYLPYFEDEPV